MATIAVDFDGTIVEHRYPEIGKELPFATETLRTLIKEHHRLILWSVREGKLLQDAIDWCHERGVDFWAVNRDYPEEEENKNNHFSRKIKADYFIDDRNIGGLPDWGQIYRMISEHKTYTQIIRESMGRVSPDDIPKKRHWWQF
uniref:BT0820 family HAD-type phosphatase n=1 Tax=Prevotella sp. TaxID=59823 RepID=UPI00402642AA